MAVYKPKDFEIEGFVIVDVGGTHGEQVQAILENGKSYWTHHLFNIGDVVMCQSDTDTYICPKDVVDKKYRRVS